MSGNSERRKKKKKGKGKDEKNAVLVEGLIPLASLKLLDLSRLLRQPSLGRPFFWPLSHSFMCLSQITNSLIEYQKRYRLLKKKKTFLFYHLNDLIRRTVCPLVNVIKNKIYTSV